MAKRYEIDLVIDAKDDLRQLRSFDRQKVITAIEEHLTFGPKIESRSRIKRLQQPMWAEFRLRVNGFRIYYNVYDDRDRGGSADFLERHGANARGAAMKRIEATDKRRIGLVLPKPGGDDVLVEREGRPVAVIVPLDKDEYWWYLKERSPEFAKSLARAEKHAREGKVTRLADVKKEFGLK